jgi:ribosomal-protein-alanine N-acetyltransferase
MQSEITIRPMRLDDLETVYQLERRLFPNPWPKCFFENDLELPNTIALVAEDNGGVFGYALATYTDTNFHITNIGIAENYQRKGIASQCMAQLEREAREVGCRYAYLEVRTHNTAAITFYKKHGYRIDHVHELYYIDGDDAYVMEKEL